MNRFANRWIGTGLALLWIAPMIRAQQSAPMNLMPARATAPAKPSCAFATSTSSDGHITYFRHCSDTPEMVSFRGGSFSMGDSNDTAMDYEKPAHEVKIAPFSIGRYETTRGEWQACVTAKACTDSHQQLTGPEAGDRYPIASVSWMQAKEYVAWLARRTGRPYRLPSESEWEYAARAGSKGKFGWAMGEAEQTTCAHANVLDHSATVRHPELSWSTDCDDGFPEAAPVGSFPPNAWGVYDMQGNVWEWVEDCWHPDYQGAPADGSAWVDNAGCQKRVNRGGGWGNGPKAVRLSNRDADPATGYSNGLGFRVALTIAAPTAP